MEKPASVDDYMAGVPEDKRAALQRLREIIRSAAPDATEAIAWGMPGFNYHGNLVTYAAFKEHCSFFPMSGTVLEQFKDELKGYVTSKGTIQFRVDKPLPAALVKKIVKARMKENEALRP